MAFLLLSVHPPSPDEVKSSKAHVCYCFPVFRLISEHIFQVLFHFVNLASGCSLIPGILYMCVRV